LARRHGWTDEQIEDLANFEQRTDFTEKEKAALRLTERVTHDAHTVDDQLWSELRQHFDEGEIVELVAAIGLFNYFNRFNNALQVEPTASVTPSRSEGSL
jgi:alkylhydroperoxidase family enzyme